MNKENLPLIILIIVFIMNAGSYLPDQFRLKRPTVAVRQDNEMSSELRKVVEEFKKIESKEDRLLIYKLFAGSAEYLSIAENLSNTGQFDPVLGKVQSSYGWNREKYPKFTDAVSAYLVSENYDEPKQLQSKEDKQKFAKIFNKLAEALQ
jgi:hypothetical protein